MQVYILMQTPTDLDLLKRVKHLILIFGISGWFNENEST